VAGDVDDLPEELPLSALLDFVSEYRRPREEAQAFIILCYAKYYSWAPPQWLCDEIRVEPLPDPDYDAGADQDPKVAYRHFWRNYEGFTVDWLASNIVYEGPLITPRSGRSLATVPDEVWGLIAPFRKEARESRGGHSDP
jgi:hypothetical protein